MMALFACCILLLAPLGADASELFQTPHGYRPSQCIIRHDEDVEIEELADGSGVLAHYPRSKFTKFFPADPYCVENVKQLFSYNLTGMETPNPQGFRAWEDYAFFSTPSIMGNFTATYEIPNESPSGGSQLLYYFIGLQNNDENDAAVTIVQPAVNYDLSGAFPQGWSMEPWNCCPAGQSHQGKNVVASPGESVLAWIYALGGTNDVVVGLSKIDGSNSTALTVKNNNRNFDYACCTLDGYAANCSETNAKPFNFTKMALAALDGSNVEPDWRISAQASCGGGVIQNNDGSSVYLYGHDMPKGTKNEENA